jgi:flagellar protein FliO/FliZ
MKSAGGSRALWVILAAAVVIGLLLLLPTVITTSDPIAVGPDIVPETAAAAADEAPEGFVSGTGGFSMGPGALFSLAWRLGLVAVVVALAVVGLRWWGRKTSGPTSTTGFLRVIDTLPISNDRTLHLVALGSRVITIGATQQQISFLNELTPDECEDVLAKNAETAPASFSGFAEELVRTLRRDQPRERSGPDGLNAVIGEDRP